MNIKICIVHYRGYFGQDLPTEKTLSINEIKIKLKEYGYDVLDKCITEIANEKELGNYIYVLGSHQNPTVKSYINDVVLIRLINKICIPNVALILAHENKGIQALVSIENGINLVEQQYHLVCKDDDVITNKVNKVTAGSGSSGVFIPKEGDKYKKAFNKIFWKNIKVQDGIDFFKTKLLSSFFKRSRLNVDYYRTYFPLVTQEKIEGVGYDYKVLIFFDKCYVLKRYTRKNDFRSSGSGNFEFCECDNNLLETAYNFRVNICAPYLSLDIMPDINGSYHVIEYQALHFGPYTKKYAGFFYERKSKNDWIKNTNNNSSIEHELAYALDKYIRFESD